MSIQEILAEQGRRKEEALERAMKLWKLYFGHPSEPHNHSG